MPLGSRDVGRRVVVRYLLAVPEPHASATDVLGTLVALDAGGLEVETESGQRVRVPVERLVAGKAVPPRPSVRMRVAADTLQRVCGQGWPARTEQRLGDWLLREAAGFTGRANSVLPTGDPGMPLAQALAEVEAFYAAHDLPALAQAVIGTPVEQRLLDAGWQVARHHEGALVQVASVAQARRAGSGSRGGAGSGQGSRIAPEVEMLDSPTESWMSVYGRTSGVPAAVVAAVLAGPPVTAFAAIHAGGADGPVAIGRGVVTGDWLGLAAVEVVPARRREGLARAVVDALLQWGAERGARSAYLQTMPDNAAALGLYQPYGFVTHHRYRYLAPGSDAPARPE